MHFVLVEFFYFYFYLFFFFFFFFFCNFCNFYKGDLFGEFLFAILRTIPSERVYSKKKEFALARREIKPILQSSLLRKFTHTSGVGVAVGVGVT